MITDIFKEINSTNSVKDKEEILHKYYDDDELREILEANLNTNRLFQFNKVPEYTTARPVFKEKTHKEFMELLIDLENRVITGNNAKDAVRDFLSHCWPDKAELYGKVLTKKAIGVGASTVNKVWPDLVPDFKLMLAPNKIPDIVNIKYPCYLQPKLDGYRCIYIPGEGMFSRAGNRIANNNLQAYFECVNSVKNYVLDGELYFHGIKFNKLTSILNKEDGNLPLNLKFHVYDCVPLKDWKKEECKIPYEQRLKTLRSLVNDNIADYKKVIDVSTDVCNNAKQVKDMYKKYLDKDYEGVMLKAIDGKYKWKRVTIKSGEMLKLKPFKSEDLKITGIYEGEDNFKGTTGGFIVDYNGVAVSVGSGLSLAIRKAVWESPSNYIGKTIEVKYLEETEDKSLRHPSFKCFRPDKD